MLRNTQGGNIVDWINSEWNIDNMQSIEMTYRQICQQEKLGMVVIPQPMNFSAASTVCQGFHGNLAIVQSYKEEIDLMNLVRPNYPCKSKFLLSQKKFPIQL